MDDEFGFDGDDDIPTREELAVWLSEFMNSTAAAESMYRSHFCDLLAHRVYADFGVEGLCELMGSIDKRGLWISDILLENNDLDEVMFSKYGTYDNDVVRKARSTSAMAELNQKIWRLRKRYAKLIVDEIMSPESGTE
jgi:hypothetical protein